MMMIMMMMIMMTMMMNTMTTTMMMTKTLVLLEPVCNHCCMQGSAVDAESGTCSEHKAGH